MPSRSKKHYAAAELLQRLPFRADGADTMTAHQNHLTLMLARLDVLLARSAALGSEHRAILSEIESLTDSVDAEARLLADGDGGPLH